MKFPLSALTLCFGIFSNGLCLAEDTQINIRLKHSKYPYQCFALSCFYPASERLSRINDARAVAQRTCSDRFLPKESCERDKEHYDAVVQCDDYCNRAVCKKTEVATGRCVGMAYFK
jgi:hypothetical protein